MWLGLVSWVPGCLLVPVWFLFGFCSDCLVRLLFLVAKPSGLAGLVVLFVFVVLVVFEWVIR